MTDVDDFQTGMHQCSDITSCCRVEKREVDLMSGSATANGRRLDVTSAALGVAVGVAISACTVLVMRQHDTRASKRSSVQSSPDAESASQSGPSDALSSPCAMDAGRAQVARANTEHLSQPRDQSSPDAALSSPCATDGGRARSGRAKTEPLPQPRDMASLMDVVLRPPLDERVARMLESTSLCYLSTFSLDSAGEPSPHLSLMRFTYVRGEEVVLVSTKRRTKKYAQMCNSPSIAILVHDFPEVGRPGTGEAARRPGGSLSITLSGTVRAAPPGSFPCCFAQGRAMVPCASLSAGMVVLAGVPLSEQRRLHGCLRTASHSTADAPAPLPSCACAPRRV